MIAYVFFIGLGLSLVFVPAIRWLQKKYGVLDQPRVDRWHNDPTPHLGGVGIFVAFILAILLSGEMQQTPNYIFLGVGFAFLIGLVDDLWNISPPSKLVGLFVAAFILVFFGSITAFFPWRTANILVSFIWLVGIANALNLLDNMDGLAAGTALIVSFFLSYFFWKAGNETFLVLSLAIAGSTLGFWIFNFPPASIFMGDSGSLFLGLTLAELAIVREPQASNVFAVMGIPTLIFLLPILDVVMVSMTRLLRGQSPARGGRDHTSHRLVALGLNERQTLLILMGVATISGVAAVFLEAFSYYLSLVLIPIVVLVFALFSAYLGRLKVVDVPEDERSQWKVLTNWMVDLTYRRRVLEVLLDFFLISFTYYLSHIVRLGLSLSPSQISQFVESLPVVVAGSLISFFVSGVYRGVWQYVSLEDGFRLLMASIGGTILSLGIAWLLFDFEVYTGSIFIIYGLLLSLILLGSRFSFRLLDKVVKQRGEVEKMPVLIYGAGDAGELTLRECEMNPSLGYHPVGFLDDDPLKKKRTIHGIKVLGGIEMLEDVIVEHDVRGVIISSTAIKNTKTEHKIRDICSRHDVWVRQLRLDFIPLEK